MANMEELEQKLHHLQIQEASKKTEEKALDTATVEEGDKQALPVEKDNQDVEKEAAGIEGNAEKHQEVTEKDACCLDKSEMQEEHINETGNEEIVDGKVIHDDVEDGEKPLGKEIKDVEKVVAGMEGNVEKHQEDTEEGALCLEAEKEQAKGAKRKKIKRNNGAGNSGYDDEENAVDGKVALGKMKKKKKKKKSVLPKTCAEEQKSQETAKPQEFGYPLFCSMPECSEVADLICIPCNGRILCSPCFNELHQDPYMFNDHFDCCESLHAEMEHLQLFSFFFNNENNSE